MKKSENTIKAQSLDKVLSENQQALINSYQSEIAKNKNLKRLLETNPMKLAERLATFNFESSVKNNFITRALYDTTDIKSVHLRNAAIAWAAGNQNAYNEHIRLLHEKLRQESEDNYREFEGYAERLPHGPLRLFIHLLSLFTNMPEDIAKVTSAHIKLAWFKLAAKHRDFDKELKLAMENPDAFLLVHRIATMPKNIELKEMIYSLDDESKKTILEVCNRFQSMIDRAPKNIQQTICVFKEENQHLIKSENQERDQEPIIIDTRSL